MSLLETVAGLADGLQVSIDAAYSGSRPDAGLKVSEWADRYRILTTRSSPEPGPWRTARTPFARAIMDDLSPSSACHTVVFMKGVQISATECGNNWMGFNIHQAPGAMMCVQPTCDMAKRNSKQRIGPLIEDCPALRLLVKEPRGGIYNNTVLSKQFPGGILVLTGANSASGLRSMSARYLFLDEVDGYPGDVDGEGEPCALAIARTTNFSRRKIYIASTPVLSGQSRIERFYESSDQRQYWVPCPECQEFQVLEFAQLRWPKGEPEKARYICEHCHFEIPNHAKHWMLPKGEWRAQAEDRGIHGYHLSSLYSPVGWMSWEQIASKHEAALADSGLMQTFWNTILGLPWAEKGEVPDTDRLYERREIYQIGKVPEGGLLLTAGVDVQMRRLECEVVAWGRRRESWSVDYRVFHGDTSQPEVWENVARMLDEDFETAYGQPLRIAKLAVDSGFNTMPVYDFIRRMSAQRVMAIKGSLRVNSLVSAPSMIEVGPHGTRSKFGIRLWPVNTSIAKEELYRWLRQRVPDLGAGERWPVGFCHFPQYSREYFEQLTAEHLVIKVKGTAKTAVWEKIRDRNEALDARVYARAAASSLRFENWPDSRWDELEAKLGRERKTPPLTAAKPQPLTPKIGLAAAPVFKPIRANESFLE